jgi:hypothetical protein
MFGMTITAIGCLEGLSTGAHCIHVGRRSHGHIRIPPTGGTGTGDDPTKTGATVWSSDYAHDEPVTEKDVSAVVAAMDRNVRRGLDEVAVGLQQYFNSVNTTATREPR